MLLVHLGTFLVHPDSKPAMDHTDLISYFLQPDCLETDEVKKKIYHLHKMFSKKKNKTMPPKGNEFITDSYIDLLHRETELTYKADGQLIPFPHYSYES